MNKNILLSSFIEGVESGDTALSTGEESTPSTQKEFLRVPSSHIQPTSIQAYTQLIKNGTLGSQERAYLSILESHPQGLTDREAARILSLPASTISARRNGISKKAGTHLILNKNKERRTNKNGSSALVWKMR